MGNFRIAQPLRKVHKTQSLSENIVNRRTLLSLVLLMFFCAQLKAQRKSADIGVFAGVNATYGDFTKVNLSNSLAPSVKVFYRYNFNPRLALKVNAGFNQIKLAGEFNGIDLSNEPHFVANNKKNMYSASAQLQVNFLKYILGHEQFKLSPYIAIGLSANYFKYNLKFLDRKTLPATITSQEIIYKPGPTGVLIPTLEPEVKGNKLALSIPFSVGVNYNVSDKLAIGLEWNLHKIFADELDNLKDPYGVDATSMLHNNDWFSSFGVQISYLLYLGKKECPGYE
ncbi:porin family protein [Prolixibacteraceae bacterium JC049]|nr:porin family protein [Prolixibacteraceae bacterium JC049]